MKTSEIQRATLAAKIFIRKADAVLAERAEHGNNGSGTKASGSLRRTSMELSRILSTMRNPK